MKEPKEYAKELKNRFYSKEIEKYLGKFKANADAVHFALICVDEMYEIVGQIEQDCKYSNFLVDVEQEINKL